MSEIERTPLANGEYRSKTGEVLRNLAGKLVEFVSIEHDDCECKECEERWERLG